MRFFKILASKLHSVPADVERVSHLVRLDGNRAKKGAARRERHRGASPNETVSRATAIARRPKGFFFAGSSTSFLAGKPAATKSKKAHLLDSKLIGLHRVLGQQAAGAAVGEGIRRRGEGAIFEGLSKLLLLRLPLFHAKDCGEQQRERDEARPEPLSPALPRG